MSGLLSAIPGLAAHEVVVPVQDPAPATFDIDLADNLLRDLNGRIGAAYPGEDCLPWLCLNRPEVWKALCDGENCVDREYLQQNMQGLEYEADRLWRMYEKAFAIFAARPPVIEVQESLL